MPDFSSTAWQEFPPFERGEKVMPANGAERGNGLFGIYVHWPFCAAKCPYCDFNSHVRHDPVDQKTFLTAYLAELDHFAAWTKGKTVNSIFFGGGTPSLMDSQVTEAILDHIAKTWPVASNVEITLEANPTSVEANRFKAYRHAGINRVSLGVQSLRDDQLQKLGRMHSVEEAKLAIAIAQSIFERSSFDLIYARPEQTLADWEAELNEALKMAVGHISLYQLTIEQGTRYFDLFHAGKLNMPAPELAADFYELTQDLTQTYSMPAYEISNHARPGEQSQHNLLYWRYGEYLGIGAGAHGRILHEEARHATSNERVPEKWAELVQKNGHAMVSDERLTWEEESDEFLVMGLRLAEGIDPKRYAQLAGKSLKQKQIDELKALNFLQTLPNGNLRVTPNGWPVLDAVVADLAM